VLKRAEGSATWRQAQATFGRRGALAIFLTRFLLTPLALPTTLIAGSSHYTFQRFLALDTLGELVWIALYGGLGYLFAEQWEMVSDLASNLTGALLGLLVLAVGGWLAYRARLRRVWAAHAADSSAG
jgi:membrane protein DedA with SNARE-associated domain